MSPRVCLGCPQNSFKDSFKKSSRYPWESSLYALSEIISEIRYFSMEFHCNFPQDNLHRFLYELLLKFLRELLCEITYCMITTGYFRWNFLRSLQEKSFRANSKNFSTFSSICFLNNSARDFFRK